MSARLEVIKGYDMGKVFEIKCGNTYRIGRDADGSNSDIRLDARDNHISRNHFTIEYSNSGFFIKDTGSTNGTYVKHSDDGNSERVSTASLDNGDMVLLGGTVIRLKIIEESRQDISEKDTPISTTSVIDNTISNSKQSECAITMNAPSCSVCNRKMPPAPETKDASVYLCSSCVSVYEPVADAACSPKGYTVLKQLGEGSMGIVYLARHNETGRLAAVKTIIPEMIQSDEKSIQFFMREISIMSSLNHPNITKLYEYNLDGGTHYFISEYMPDGDLDEHIRRTYNGPMPVKTACGMACQLLSALACLHENGCVHRDIKPGNVLMKFMQDKGYILKISDFGLSKIYENAGLTNITKTTDRRGTPLFMAPEQFINYRYVKPSTDLYSVGIILYFMLSHDFPYMSSYKKKEDPFALLRKKDPILSIIEDIPDPILEKRRDLPQELARIVDRSIRKNPADRFASAQEMQKALSVFCPDL